MNLRQNMRSHVESHYPILYLVNFEEEAGDALIVDLAGDLKVLEWNMARGFVHFDNEAPMAPTTRISPPPWTTGWTGKLDNHFLIVRDAHLALRDNPLAVARPGE